MMLLHFIATHLGLVQDIDSPVYIALSEGRYAEVVRPFSNRVLAPLLAHYIGFNALHLVSILLFGGSVIWLLRRLGIGVWRAAPFLMAPWLFSFAYNLYMPDMLVCALTACFLGVLARVGIGAALPILTLMIMARESSIVIGGVWLLITIGKMVKSRTFTKRAFWQVAGICLAMAVGMKLVRLISASSPGDINGLGILYMPIKAAVNGFVSFTGVYPWNDVYARDLPQFYTHEPLWRMACPPILRWGRFTEIGIYEWHPLQILVTAKIMFLAFGVLVPYAISRGRKVLAAASTPWLQLAFFSGFAYWLLTPICGFSPMRYIGYAWPLFWFAPLMLIQKESSRVRRFLLGAHFGLLILAYFVL